jgi:hypothetical protein
MHRTSRNIMKRGKTHTYVNKNDFLAGFKVEASALDDDTALRLGCLAHIGSFRRVACVAAAFECAWRRGLSPRKEILHSMTRPLVNQSTSQFFGTYVKILSGCIDKADEVPVHNRKGVGNQKEQGGGGQVEGF